MDVAQCRLTHSLQTQLRPVAKQYDFIHKLLGPLVKPGPRVLTYEEEWGKQKNLTPPSNGAKSDRTLAVLPPFGGFTESRTVGHSPVLCAVPLE